MKSWLRWSGLALLVVLAGCSQHTGHTVSINPFAGPPADAVPPPPPAPVREGPCPYLDNEFVAQVNQRPVSFVRTGDIPPHPACFFHGRDGRTQLWVWTYLGPPGAVDALVHTYAPEGTARPVRIDDWQGGFSDRRTGGVFAIGRADTAIVVASDTRKDSGRRIALKVIRTLHL